MVEFKVVFDFQAEEAGELTVAAGEVVFAFAGEDGIFGTEDDTRDGWVLVQSEDHASTGYVPMDFLEKREPVFNQED